MVGSIKGGMEGERKRKRGDERRGEERTSRTRRRRRRRNKILKNTH